jgi:hypothetical protein
MIIELHLEEKSVNLIEQALQFAYDERCEDADEGGAERIGDLLDEILSQRADPTHQR